MGGAPWVWFDVDDVIVDLAPLLKECLHEMSGADVPVEEWHSLELLSIHGVASDARSWSRLRSLWAERRVLERCEVFPGAAEVMRNVSSMGFRVGLVTARGWHPDGESITRALVTKEGLPVDAVVVTSHGQSKPEACMHLGPAAMAVDDTPSNVEAWMASGVVSFLVDRPWNRKSDLPRIDGISHVTAAAAAIVREAGFPKPSRPAAPTPR